MPQISLYIDEKTLRKIERAAQQENLSISRWVGDRIKKSLKTEYSADFSSLFGSIQDETFRSPDRSVTTEDIPRENL
ncbi:MAG: toxin-antitoxin system antiodte VapB [Bacteroidetes bacterium HLUCCA01]|nr:MAG: toxin-antitoxin system antiodte VapB [Bacteroidetes bacterium HLUCCA01]